MTLPDWMKEIETRAEKATPGPWPWIETGLVQSRMATIPAVVRSHNRTPHLSHEDAKFISDARTDIPRLLEALRIAIEALSEIEKGESHSKDDDEIARIALAQIHALPEAGKEKE